MQRREERGYLNLELCATSLGNLIVEAKEVKLSGSGFNKVGG